MDQPLDLMRNPGEVRVQMPEMERSTFMREQIAELKSALHEAIKQRSVSPSTTKQSKPLIRKVPSHLTTAKPEFRKHFEPKVVALGPLHHGKPEFEEAEKTKRQLAALFLHETKTKDEILFERIKHEIKELRNCYNQDDIKGYKDEQLAWMFLVDGCAVLYAIDLGLVGDFERLNTKPDQLVFSLVDLFLLENQIPYRVLQILMLATQDPRKWEKSVTELIRRSISGTIISDAMNIPVPVSQESRRQEYNHLLELLRSEFLTGIVEESSHSMTREMLQKSAEMPKDWMTFGSIKELKQSGVDVKPSKGNNLKNVSFHRKIFGSLKMPRLRVDDTTASKFMNMVALEMCKDFWNDFGVSNYLCFLGSLIQTGEDVKELRLTGMLHNHFGNDEEVADLIRRMTKDLVSDEEMYQDVRANINKYYNSWVKRIYSHYFSRDWSVIAFSGALLGLILAFLQTYFAISPTRKNI